MSSKNTERDQQKSSFLSRFFKRLFLSLLTISVLLTLFVYLFLDFIIKNQIINEVHEASDGLYVLEINELDAKFWSGAITMNDVWLKPEHVDLKSMNAKDSGRFAALVNLHFDSVNISSIRWLRYILNNEKLEIGTVLIHKPDFIVNGFFSGKGIKENDRNFLDLLPGIIVAFTGSLRIDEIIIKEGHLHYDLHGKDGIVHQLADSVFLDLKKIVIDTISPRNALYSKEAYIDLRNYRLRTPDNLHNFRIQHIKGSVHDSTLFINDIYYSQRDSIKENFRDDMKITMAKIEGRGVDYGNLLRDQKIFLRTMILKSPKVELHSSVSPVSKYVKKGEDENSILDQLVPYLSGSFKIDSFLVANGEVHYEIFNEKIHIIQNANHIFLDIDHVLVDSTKSGFIYAEDLSLKLKNYFLQKGKESKLNINSIKASLSDSVLHLEDLNFYTDEGDSYEVSVNEIIGEGLDYLSIIKNKKAKMNSFVIKSPIIKMTSIDTANQRKKEYPSPKKFFQDVLGPLADASLNIEKFEIEDAQFNHLIKRDSGDIEHKAENIFVSIYNVTVDSASAEKYEFYDSMHLKLRNYELKWHAMNCKILIDELWSNSTYENIFMKGIYLTQINSFGKTQKYYFQDSIASAYVSGFDYNRFIEKKEIHAQVLELNRMRLHIFLDESKSTGPDYSHSMPHQLAQKIKFYLRVDTTHLNESNIYYWDKEPQKLQPALLTFQNMNVNLINFTNDKLLMTDSTPAVINGNFLLMGQGNFNFHLSIPLLSPDFSVNYGGDVNLMQGEIFNDLLAFADVRIDKGEILPSKFEIEVINGNAFGEMEFVYKDLKITVLNEKEKPRKFYSLIGDFVIKDNNPNKRGEDPEIVHICSRLHPEDGFFYFLWKVIKGGIVETVTKSSLYKVSNESKR